MWSMARARKVHGGGSSTARYLEGRWRGAGGELEGSWRCRELQAGHTDRQPLMHGVTVSRAALEYGEAPLRVRE